MKEIKIKLRKLEITALHMKDWEIYRGLMLRKRGHALLEFSENKKHKIWTLFMLYPLDLIFINKNREVVDITENAPPVNLNPQTWKLYTSKNKFKYLLELDSRDQLGVFFRIGDVLEW